jgi:hypothetical protein
MGEAAMCLSSAVVRLSAICVISLALLTPALADCQSDLQLQHDLVDQYNNLASAPACDSGAQQAVMIGLLQQDIEVTTRLQSCRDVRGGTSVAKLRSLLGSYAADTKAHCRMIDAYGQLDRDLEELQDAFAHERQRVQEEGRQLEEMRAKLEEQIRQLDEAEARKKTEKLKAKESRTASQHKPDMSRCADAVAYMKKLAAAGNDVSALKADLGRRCKTD